MNLASRWTLAATLLASQAAFALPTFQVFEGVATNAAGLTPVRDNFRAAIGGGTAAGANGSFGGLRREINWDGVPASRADPNFMPADFFNVNSPRGAVFSTPGSGFMVSANSGESAEATLFGYANDFQAFSAQRLFTAIDSNITDVHFFLPGSNTAASTTAFGVIFTDVEVTGLTRLQFFDDNDDLIFTRDALVTGNQGLGFLGATVTGGSISRVRITAGLNTLGRDGSLGNANDDVVVMDDFIYAEPGLRSQPVPAPGSLALAALGLGLAAWRRRKA